MNGAFYVYALKDPRTSPAKPFYIGKGVGTRAWDHLLTPDKTPKGQRIAEIAASGHKVVVSKICDGLTELEALKMEAELISCFGTAAAGGTLMNSVLPTGKRSKQQRHLTIPLGAPEKAQLGLALLKDAVLELAQANGNGVTNAEVCHALGLHSNYAGGSKDYLSWSVLGLLMEEGRLKRQNSRGRGYHVAQVR
ncbi:MAG TPA: GIY-YIG nuclease family protein [Bryobacteraceae bacterium]|nr:GIY-YIG nuclease family protein [Bryobacteraceae bacterium]